MSKKPFINGTQLHMVSIFLLVICMCCGLSTELSLMSLECTDAPVRGQAELGKMFKSRMYEIHCGNTMELVCSFVVNQVYPEGINRCALVTAGSSQNPGNIPNPQFFLMKTSGVLSSLYL